MLEPPPTDGVACPDRQVLLCCSEDLRISAMRCVTEARSALLALFIRRYFFPLYLSTLP